MKTIDYPKCALSVEINLAHASDKHGEVFTCPNCGYKFRFTDK